MHENTAEHLYGSHHQSLVPDWVADCAGKELYLIPGIDMLNHSTRPKHINTSLQRRTETVSKQGSNCEGSADFSGFFAIEAGGALSLSLPCSKLQLQSGMNKIQINLVDASDLHGHFCIL